jgi:hypothetical protein
MKLRSKWSNVFRTCILENNLQARYSITVTTVADITQLIIMLIGLLSSRREKCGLLRYLCLQVGGVEFRVLLLTMTMLTEIGPGLDMACRRDVSGDPMRGRF